MVTTNVFVIDVAGFQLPLPACDATIETLPAPVNVRFVPPAIEAGPEPTAKETGSPLEAVAASPTASVVSRLPIAGKLIVWLLLTAVTVMTKVFVPDTE